jgi:NAD(P)-dependent dehydrogenase (short-subunit alcohol dehydrogenase family)
MQKTIAIVGATGNLGERIATTLLQEGAIVHAVVRSNSNPEKVKTLQSLGAKIITVDMSNVSELTHAFKGASCVVSALSGLREVIIDAQKLVLDASIAAGVPRFIPSDYSLDFTKTEAGSNRNLDWRREFHTYLDKQPIKATSIFNGAFADMLTAEMPMILFKQKKIFFWGNAKQSMDFTTIQDTANFTAHVALDDTTPRYLRIAGDQVNAHDIKGIASEVLGESFGFFRPGGLGAFGVVIKLARFFAPGNNELYPAWQGMQYMHNMLEGSCKMTQIDNGRYASLRFKTVKDVLLESRK